VGVILSIAIDGPAGAGKSTVAREVARKLKITYIDTGAMYRALTYAALQQSLSLEDGEKLRQLLDSIELSLYWIDGVQHVSLNGVDISNEIRSFEVTKHVSTVAQHPMVREKMVQIQQEMARKQEVVMDGRDIGTHVLPQASLKIFLNASIKERAWRRYKELIEKGETPDLQQVEQEMATRDQMDIQRETAPLRPASDAIIVDTTGMGIDEVIDKIITLYQSRVKGEKA
jgi:cytidylate kinase